MPLFIYFPFILWSGMVARMCELSATNPRD